MKEHEKFVPYRDALELMQLEIKLGIKQGVTEYVWVREIYSGELKIYERIITQGILGSNYVVICNAPKLEDIRKKVITLTKEQADDLSILLNIRLRDNLAKDYWNNLNGIFKQLSGRDHE